MKQLLLILLIWPVFFLTATADVRAETFPALPNSPALIATLNNTDSPGVSGLPKIMAHINITGHQSGIERRDRMRKTVGIKPNPAYGISHIAINWNTQATLMILFIILMWPMGKRKLAVAGLRFLFRATKKLKNIG